MKGYVERVLKSGPKTEDDIASSLQISVPETMQALTMLEIEGKVYSRGGRWYLAETSKQPEQTPKSKPAKAPKKENNSEPVMSKQVCRLVYFDAQGRFTKDPQKATKVKTKKVTEREQKRYVERVDVDGAPGGAYAEITQAGDRYAVKVFDPGLVAQKREAKAKGDTMTVSAIERYEQDLGEMILEDYKKGREDTEATAALEASFKSDLARKAAKTRSSKAAKLTEADKTKAGNEAKALEARIGSYRAEISSAKGQKKEKLRRRIGRLEGAKTQLEKISQGKAYKWPSAGQVR